MIELKTIKAKNKLAFFKHFLCRERTRGLKGAKAEKNDRFAWELRRGKKSSRRRVSRVKAIKEAKRCFANTGGTVTISRPVVLCRGDFFVIK